MFGVGLTVVNASAAVVLKNIHFREEKSVLTAEVWYGVKIYDVTVVAFTHRFGRGLARPVRGFVRVLESVREHGGWWW